MFYFLGVQSSAKKGKNVIGKIQKNIVPRKGKASSVAIIELVGGKRRHVEVDYGIKEIQKKVVLPSGENATEE